MKPPIAKQHSTATESNQHREGSSLPQDGGSGLTGAATTSAYTPKQKKLVPFTVKDKEMKEAAVDGMSAPQVHVQNTDFAPSSARPPRAIDGMLMPTTDESGTQISSSSGSAKPPSLDGKSVASGTTFALDEKESLRPDDSASVKATDDEDVYSPPGTGMAGSRPDSDDGVRAFRDQLREISCMDPSRQSSSPASFGHTGTQPQGVLYVPPQGPGVGTVPGTSRSPPIDGFDMPPDPKLLEALDSPKDRIMVLKLEQDIVDFVKDAKESSLKLPQTNAFYRMLAHRLADYYMLGHIVDESTMAVRIYKTPNCRLPPPLTGIATPSTAASTPPPIGPQMKILRRGVDPASPAIVNGSNVASKATSENGESGNDDDKKSKVPASREEREARYEAARRRIMGSAKAPESPEEVIEVDNSRSSSAAGKKTNRKKQRADSDDDFEARSAYSAYYPAAFSSGGPTPTSYAFPSVVDSQTGQMPPPSYGGYDTTRQYQQQGPAAMQTWQNQGFQAPSTSGWMQNQPPNYDLSSEFQRSMAFQPTPNPSQSPNMQHAFHPAYNQQYGAVQQAWPQQTNYMSGYPQPGPNYMQGYASRPPRSNQFQEPPTYQFGQLPSQTFPGRPPSKLEHPLPGSYKSKHFNPQSQAFIPAQPSGTSMPPFSPQSAHVPSPVHGGGYDAHSPLQTHSPMPSQRPAFGQNQVAAPAAGATRIQNQPMTHPLPQPVFPRQPSPNMPLPPKPEGTPPRPGDLSANVSVFPNQIVGQSQSSIAKWGTPASLPAKPPPSAEPFDPTKFAQNQRQASVPGRMASGVPSFGSMPPMAGGYGGRV